MSMKLLYANRSEEFILAKLKEFYKKKSIIIKYTVLYIHEENRLAEQG